MSRDVSGCNTYNYSDAHYWDSRYIQEANCGSFDWYQRYSALRPFVQKYMSTKSRVLMVGCGNAVMSEDMIKDGFEDIVNIDISSVAIEMMRKKYKSVPQLKYIQMDVRDMSFFPDDSFDSIIDKGTLDSLMCGAEAPISASLMLGEVSRLLKPGGVYMLITYGDPTIRMPHINRPVYNWKIELYIIPRPGFQRSAGSVNSSNSYLEPIPTSEKATCIETILTRFHAYVEATNKKLKLGKQEPLKQVDVLKEEAENLKKKQLRILGKDIKGMGLQELREFEQQLNDGLLCIKDRKEQILVQQLEESRMQEQKVVLENEILRKQIEQLQGFYPPSHYPASHYIDSQPMVESDYAIEQGSASPKMACNTRLGDSDSGINLLQLGPPTSGECQERKMSDGYNSFKQN